jgi:hypothetical protein
VWVDRGNYRQLRKLPGNTSVRLLHGMIEDILNVVAMALTKPECERRSHLDGAEGYIFGSRVASKKITLVSL